MLRQTLSVVVIYGANTALARAVTLLAALYLSRHYSIADIGVYGIAQTVAQLAVPLISLGSSSAIIREGVSDKRVAARLVLIVFANALSVATMVLAVVSVGVASYEWLAVGILLGVAEAMHASLIAYSQGQDRQTSAVVQTAVRVLGILATLVASQRMGMAMIDLLYAQAWVSLAVAAGALGVIKLPATLGTGTSEAVRKALRYSAVTIPHSAALWMVSGSDRMWLAKIVSIEAAGEYTMAYTVGQAGLLINSGVAAAMAARVARDYDYWQSDGALSSFLNAIGYASTGVLAGSLVFVSVNQRWLHWFDWPNRSVYMLASMVASAFLVSNLYIAYAAFLFYHRRTWLVTIGTLAAAPLSVVALYSLISLFGSYGAPLGTLTGYAFMAAAYLMGLRRTSGEFRHTWPSHAGILIKHIAIMLAIGYAFTALAT